MSSTEGCINVVLNGEISNHVELHAKLSGLKRQFVTRTHNEGFLLAYKQRSKQFVHHLNGMFAFVVYDALNGAIILARDRAGEESLFYYLDGQGISFASESRVLMANPTIYWGIASDELDYCLKMSCVLAKMCILQGFS